MTRSCPHCGTINRFGSNFCNNCGTDLRDGEQQAATPASPPDEGPTHPAEMPATDVDKQTPDAVPPTTVDQDTVDESAVDDIDAEEPLQPLFDLGMASVQQPWLGAPDADAGKQTGEQQADEPAARPGAGSKRLVTGVQGLLDPLNISSPSNVSDGETAQRRTSGQAAPMLTADESERIRRVMGSAPAPAMQMHSPAPSRFPRLRIPWIFWLIGLAIGLPVFGLPVFGFGPDPAGGVVTWPGVEAAHAAIDALPPGEHVLFYFAYDPATSGEMDLLATPALQHLLDRRSNLTFVTLNPNGPATIRRVVHAALDGRIAQSEIDVALRRITARTVYLSGGAAVLPLVGVAPSQTPKPTASGRTPPLPAPALAVLLAPRAEDVQHWLELVQPLDGIPAVAFTGAGADPMVRAYLDSGQLRGLVSGFDGGEAYAALLDDSRTENEAYRVQAVAQNWGHMALFLILMLGNVAGFLQRNREET